MHRNSSTLSYLLHLLRIYADENLLGQRVRHGDVMKGWVLTWEMRRMEK